MSVWQLVVAVLGHHVIPCILASVIIGVALWFLFGPLRLRRATHRVLFLYVALVKAALALWAGVRVSCLADDSPVFFLLAFRLPDVVADDSGLDARSLGHVFLGSDLAGHVLLVLLLAGAALLCYRWIRLAPVYRSVYAQNALATGAARGAARLFDQLVDRVWAGRRLLPRPRLLVINGLPGSAFTMGMRPPIVVVSAQLVEQLAERELKAVFAHELSHLCRFDYLGRWLATILHDIMIWNPFAWLWYSALVDEQENAADEYAADLLDDPEGVASGLVEVAACAQGISTTSLGPVSFCGGSEDPDRLARRVQRLLAKARRPRPRLKCPAALVYLGLAVFLAIQPNVTLCLPRLLDLLA